MSYDLILVGTGFASSFFLKKYLEKSGPDKKVLVLERGRLYNHSDRLKTAQGEPPAYFDSMETPLKSVINNNTEKPWVFGLYFGGGSNCWWGCTPRFMPNDFKLKTLYGKGFDWPYTYDDLETYYSEAEQIIGISGPSDTPFPKSREYPLPPHIFSTVDRKMKTAYGNQWINQPTARASVQWGNRNACCSNSSCFTCPSNAKFTIENGVSSIYKDPRVELKYGLQVYKLDIQNNTVKGVICTSSFAKDVNKPVVYNGDLVALGANAIFNAHILLASGDTNPLTGTGLSEQRSFFIKANLGMDNLGGSSSITANGYMEYDGPFRKDSASCLMENHNGPFVRLEKGKWRKIARFKFLLEAIPDQANRVKLSKDPFKPEIDYGEESEYVRKGKTRIENNIAKILAPLPVEQIFPAEFETTESHVLGTFRMGTAPENSVVDKNLIHHTYRNLFILGGGAFPAISAANPSLTISAISLKAADASF